MNVKYFAVKQKTLIIGLSLRNHRKMASGELQEHYIYWNMAKEKS